MPEATGKPTVILSLDNDLSQLPQRDIDKILQEWQRERVLGIPAQKRLRALLGVLKGERLA
jgi:hypothetical protein